MYQDIKIRALVFEKQNKLDIWHWFSHIRVYLQQGRFHHRNSPQWNGIDANVSLTRMRCALSWVWMDLIYPSMSLNAAPSDRAELNSHLKSVIHPHFTTVSGGAQAWEKAQGKSKSNLGKTDITSPGGWRQTRRSSRKSTHSSNHILLPVPEFLLHLETAFPCLVLHHMLVE